MGKALGLYVRLVGVLYYTPGCHSLDISMLASPDFRPNTTVGHYRTP